MAKGTAKARMGTAKASIWTVCGRKMNSIRLVKGRIVCGKKAVEGMHIGVNCGAAA